jgi:hypothetical protein
VYDSESTVEAQQSASLPTMYRAEGIDKQMYPLGEDIALRRGLERKRKVDAL